MASQNSDLYLKSMLKRRIELNIDECHPSFIEKHMLNQLRQNNEGKCVQEGYLKPDSISDILYSAGILTNGIVQYEVVFNCEICNPQKGAVYTVRFQDITNPGIHAELIDESGNKPLTVFLFQSMHERNKRFKKYNDPEHVLQNKSMRVKIVDTRFEFSDLWISAIAVLVD